MQCVFFLIFAEYYQGIHYHIILTIKQLKHYNKMKKGIISMLGIVTLVVLGVVLINCADKDPVMKKKNGVYTIDTTTLTADVKGFNGPTPLIITIKDDIIIKVEALENQETPKFFEQMKKGGMLDRWNGMNVADVPGAAVDVVSGCTYSSNAVIENVNTGVAYYQVHKK